MYATKTRHKKTTGERVVNMERVGVCVLPHIDHNITTPSHYSIAKNHTHDAVALQYHIWTLLYFTHHHITSLVPVRLLPYSHRKVREVSCPISEGIVPINNH